MCCSQRLNNFIITVGSNNSGVGNAVCIADGGDVQGKWEIARDCVSPLKGRYIHVKLKGSQRVLTLCEIKVYRYQGNELLHCYLLDISIIYF